MTYTVLEVVRKDIGDANYAGYTSVVDIPLFPSSFLHASNSNKILHMLYICFMFHISSESCFDLYIAF